MANQFEAALVGAVLADPSQYFAVAGTVSGGDFEAEWLGAAFNTIARLVAAGEAVNAVTVGSELEVRFDEVIANLATLQRDCLSPESAETFASKVADAARSRKVVAAIAATRDRIAAGDGDAIIELQSEIERLSQPARSTYLSFDAAIRQGLSKVEEVAGRRELGGAATGVTFGVPALDAMFQGIYGPRLVVLAGRPGSGKTALALQSALTSAKRAGMGIGIISLEMGIDELAQRAIANDLEVGFGGLTRGLLKEREQVEQRWASRGRVLEGLPLFIDDTTSRLNQIVARILEWKRKHDIGAVVIDHLQLVQGGEGSNRNEQLGSITRTLKRLAKKIDCPIFLLSQLNRNSEREGRDPMMTDLRDSGEIEQDADIILILRAAAELNSIQFHGDEHPARKIDMVVVKNRLGMVGKTTAPIFFLGRLQKFIEQVEAGWEQEAA